MASSPPLESLLTGSCRHTAALDGGAGRGDRQGMKPSPPRSFVLAFAGLLLATGCATTPAGGSKLHAFGAVFTVGAAGAAVGSMVAFGNAAGLDSGQANANANALGGGLLAAAIIGGAIGVGMLFGGDEGFEGRPPEEQR